MEQTNITITVSEKERTTIVRALELFADEVRVISEQTKSRYLTASFENDAREITLLASRVRDAVNKDNMNQKIRDLLAGGYKIDAIRLVRQQTTLSLKDAKDYVDNLQ